MYRVWTKNYNGGFSVMTDWQSMADCRKFVLGRWGHNPPFAYISKATCSDTFVRYNGA